MKAVPWRVVLPVLVTIIIALIPTPEDLAPHAWYYFAIFVGVIVGLILEPLPAAAIGLIGVVLIGVLGLAFSPEQRADPGFDLPGETIRWMLSGFSNTTVWLIFAAFMFAMGYEKTGLGRRVALHLVQRLGKRTLGLGYAITLSDLILAPFTPSNTARSGGTIFPIIRNIPGLYGSEPGPTARKIGAYIMWTALAATCVTSSMFLTALAPNLLAIELVNKTVNLQITWTQWFVGFLPVGVILLAALPYLVYKLYPPEIKGSSEVPEWARQEIAQMGRLSRQEIVMALLALVALVLWILGRDFIDATTVALGVICLMLILNVVKWSDVLANGPAWNVLVWFATLVTLAGGLNRVGFIVWFSDRAAGFLEGLPVTLVMISLVALFFFIHYFFASITAQTTAVLPVMLAVGAAVPGMPVTMLALLLCYSLGIMGIITPYATGPSPIYYGSGFIDRRAFWLLGLVFGVIFLAVLLVVGLPYLSILY
ncbi:anion permease [Caldilinea sp.]|jgi:L-tartrate/succinate antiporter|uniref:anion permease n=1 Tax=Caldilinea sp. TaxID=2293560 RepID=UPI0026017612|nr:anion permease [uncultured Caldilinea sp.]